MNIGIIGAMKEEIEILKSSMFDLHLDVAGSCKLYQGRLEGVEVTLVESGIGKVNAAVATTLLLERYQPSFVINTGSAGGFHKDLQIGDIAISSEVRYHDVDAVAFGYEVGQVPKMPPSFKADSYLVKLAMEAAQRMTHVKSEKGLIVTGDIFLNDVKKVAAVQSKFPELLASEMEAAAVAQTCFHFHVPFVVIRSLSDIAGKNSSLLFDQFLHQAARRSADVVRFMLRELVHDGEKDEC